MGDGKPQIFVMKSGPTTALAGQGCKWKWRPMGRVVFAIFARLAWRSSQTGQNGQKTRCAMGDIATGSPLRPHEKN
jgi:hypothetical protein